MTYILGQHIKTKKPHVCGNDIWEITRTGVDVKIKCLKCNREIMLSKLELDKKINNKQH